MPFSTVFQLYRSSQRSYPCFCWSSFFFFFFFFQCSAQYSFLATSCFPTLLSWKQWTEINLVAMAVFSPRKEYRLSRESNRSPPVIKPCKRPTELSFSAGALQEILWQKLKVSDIDTLYIRNNVEMKKRRLHSLFPQ